MANQFGNFAGSFAEAFTSVTNLHKENKRKDEIAKLQAKLIEAQIAKGEMVVDAQTTLADIMTGNFVGETEPVGEAVPAQDGRQAVPDIRTGGESVGLLDLLSGNNELPPGIQSEGINAAIQSGAIRGGDLLDFQTAQNQMNTAAQLNDSLANMKDENGNPMFILAGVNADPITGRQTQSWITNPEAKTAQVVATDIEEMQVNIDDAFEIADISNRTPPLLASGIPGAGTGRDINALFGAVKETFGFGDKGAAAEQQTVDVDRKKKLYGVITQYNIARAGANTDQARAGVMEISPSDDKSDAANALLIADWMRNKISDATISGTKIPAELMKRMSSYIDQARDGSLFEGDSQTAVDGPGIVEGAEASLSKFMDFSAEKFHAIDVPSLPDIDVPAYRAKFEQLKQQATTAIGPLVEKAKKGLADAKDFAQMGIDEVQQIKIEDAEGWTVEQIAAFSERLDQIIPSIPSGDQVKFAALSALARKMHELETKRRAEEEQE